MDKPLLIDPDAPRMLDDMLAEVLAGQFPNEKPETRKIKAATLAAAIRAMMKKEGLTVIREADMVMLQSELVDFTDADLAANGVTEEEFIRTHGAVHIATFARHITEAGLFECVLARREDDESKRGVFFTMRLFLPGLTAQEAQKQAEDEAATATIQ
jgi:hypothetical protein